MNDQFDFLVIGQGIAGTIFCSMLEDRGKSFRIIDHFNPHSSSQVAAGLVNPVTGRRIVKSWKADVAIPFAKEYYERIAAKFNQSFFHSIDALEVTSSIHEWNEWNRRMDEQNMSNYLNDVAPNELYRDKIKEFVKLVRITSSGWLDVKSFTSTFRNYWKEKSLLAEETFDIGELNFQNGTAIYRGNHFHSVIFCEGYKSLENIFWNSIPLVPAKGEIATISCEVLSQDFILLSGMFFIPIGNHQFRCGATYEWKFDNDLPTSEGKSKLEKMIGDVLNCEWKMISHTSGVRPTVRDRRPIIGVHPEHKNLYIFNGMGTKGVMLAPYFSNHFIEHILEGKPLDKEVDVNRFLKKELK